MNQSCLLKESGVICETSLLVAATVYDYAVNIITVNKIMKDGEKKLV